MRTPPRPRRKPVVSTSSPVPRPALVRGADLPRVLARAVGLPSLLHPTRTTAWVLTGGRHGSLSVSGGRLRRAAHRLARLALVEGGSRDPYVIEPMSETLDLGRDHIRREQSRVVQKVNRVQADLRSAALRGPRLPWATRWVYAALILVVLGVDTVLNSPLTERLAGIGPQLALLVSLSISVLLLLVSHLVVAGSPPGRRVSLRRALLVVLLVGFAVFVVAGGYLRTHSTAGTHRGSYGLSGPATETSWSTLLGPATLYATAIGLLLTTFAAACLAGLHQQHQADRVRAEDEGRWEAQIEVRCSQVAHDGAAAIGQLEGSSRQLAAAHWSAYRVGLPADVADRLTAADTAWER